MRDADLRALARRGGSESGESEAQLRRRREEWRRDAYGVERLEVAALLGSELALELSEREPADTPRGLLRDLIEVGPATRARTCYAALNTVAPLWESLRFDGRARGLRELGARLLAGDDVAAELVACAEGFALLPGRELSAQLVSRSFRAGAGALVDPELDLSRGEGQAFAALGWAAAAIARLPQHERALVRARPGADLPLSAGRALRGESRRAGVRDAYAPQAGYRTPGPLGSTQRRPEREPFPASPWAAGEGGVETLTLALARQLGPWALDGVEPPGVERRDPQ